MPPELALNAHEARLLGVLVEKALTTPEQYPLSLNAATNGANQKTNRFPITDFSEAEVHVALQGLVMKHLAGHVAPAGARVDKYRHTANEALGLDDAHLAVLAELLMRGPQQPGELRARVERMAPMPTLEALQQRLGALIEKGYVRRVDPLPGSRAERYAQLIAPGLHALDPNPPAAPTPRAAVSAEIHARPPAPGLEARVLALEEEVAAMGRELARLKSELGA